MELKVLDNKGKENGAVQIQDEILAVKGSPVVMHEAVVAYLASQRSGTHGTKTRSEVSGGGTKPWKQKGTGRARSGSTRSPLWRHGGIIFGPKPRDYRQDLPKQKKKLAFKMAVNHLIEEKRLQVVEPIKLSEPKTKNVAAIYKKWQAPMNSIFVIEKVDALLSRAARNINAVQLSTVESLNTYNCLSARRIFITPAALEQLSARLAQKSEKPS
jgi:large subunit ribosomal protein L4